MFILDVSVEEICVFCCVSPLPVCLFGWLCVWFVILCTCTYVSESVLACTSFAPSTIDSSLFYKQHSFDLDPERSQVREECFHSTKTWRTMRRIYLCCHKHTYPLHIYTLKCAYSNTHTHACARTRTHARKHAAHRQTRVWREICVVRNFVIVCLCACACYVWCAGMCMCPNLQSIDLIGYWGPARTPVTLILENIKAYCRYQISRNIKFFIKQTTKEVRGVKDHILGIAVSCITCDFQSSFCLTQSLAAQSYLRKQSYLPTKFKNVYICY